MATTDETYDDASDPDDDGDGAPPNLREAEPDARERCATCAAFQADGGDVGTCRWFAWRVEVDQVCDVYSAAATGPRRPNVTTTTSNGRSDVRVTHEPTTYSQTNREASFFADIYNARFGDNKAAKERLARNEQEVRVDPPKLEARGAYPGEHTLEYRAPNLTLGSGLASTLPKWMVELTGIAARPERVISSPKVVQTFDLDPKPGIYSINVPRIVTGDAAGGDQPTSVVTSVDYTDAGITSVVLAIVGNADVPLPMLEQSPQYPVGAHLDQLIIRDLLDAIDAQVETKVIAGPGLSGTSTTGYDLHGISWQTSDLLGISQVSGIGNVSFTGSPTSVQAFWPVWGQMIANVATNRKRRPELFLMSARRWGVVASLLDDQHRPVVLPHGGFFDADETPIVSGTTPIGKIAGLPAFTSEAIPTTLGTGGNQDEIICLRASDLLLFESPPATAVFEQPLSGTLEARIQARAYFAFVPGRWPSGICSLTGSGMTFPAGF